MNILFNIPNSFLYQKSQKESYYLMKNQIPCTIITETWFG